MAEHRLKLSSILGQTEALKRLTGPLAHDRIGQTYLFTGSESVGKVATARAFAATLLCLEPVAGPLGVREACGGCLSCKRIAGDSHPDLSFIGPQGAEIRVDQVRTLQQDAQLKPYMGQWRFFVIDPADRLNESSANSLLKILEEAPPKVIFVLATAQKRRLLPTILSRSIEIPFRTPPHDEARRLLISASGHPAEEAARIYALAGGRFGLSLAWLADLHDLPELPPLSLPEAQVAFLTELQRLPGMIEPKLQTAPGLEAALRVLADPGLTLSPGLFHARRELARGLLQAPALPKAFPLLFTRLLLETTDGIKAALKKQGDVLVAAQKGNYLPALLREIGESFDTAAGEIATGQILGFLEALRDQAADAFRLGNGGDDSLLLNPEVKAGIMSCVERRGLPQVESFLHVVCRGLEQVRRYLSPALVLENLLSDLEGVPS